MRVEVWNCRGLGQRLTVRRLQEIQRAYLPDMLFLIETKKKDDYVRSVGVDLGYTNMCIVSPDGLSGGLAVFWKNDLSVQCISYDARLVDLYIEYKSINFYLSCIYGHPIPKYRNHLWEQLQRIAVNRNGPWMLCGDFNEILKHSDKKGGHKRTDGSFKHFRTMIETCQLKELHFRGNPFSWVGKRRKEVIEVCLDKVFINDELLSMFPASETEYLEIVSSDHSPLIISIEVERPVKRGNFRFDKRLTQYDDFVETVKTDWDITSQNTRTLSLILSKSRSTMAQWKRRHRCNSAKEITLLKQQIDTAERDCHTTPEALHRLKSELNTAYRNEEHFWYQKSRNNWLQLGDRNTKFFHGKTKMRKAKNCIKTIRDEQGIAHRKDTAIANVAELYFQNLFTSSKPISLEELQVSVTSKVTPEMNSRLCREVTDEEIQDAVFLINPNKAPGADGITSAFFHHFWSTTKEAIYNMVRNFFRNGRLEEGINHTQLCLIPKSPDSTQMSDYRPISLCNVSYKIVSKILVLRLKECIEDIISPSQAAFVPGRNITDNVLVAHELLHAIKSKKECSHAYVAIKTDISKAYDRVEWSFLEQSMRSMGFAEQWILWIMKCVTSVSYSVMINGSAYGHIRPSRGIRQGDPLSPYLFLFCAEVLSQLLDEAERVNRIHGLQITKACPSITHLLFADDSLFFCRATTEECAQLADIMKQYEQASGQMINYNKSSVIFGSKISDPRRRTIHQTLRIQNVGGGGKYLGLPERIERGKIAQFDYITNRVKQKLDGWYNQFLSPAGKEVLIKSVILSMPVYAMNCFLLPKSTCDAINSMLAEFWWGKEDGHKKISWVSWQRMSLPKREGGLGFRDLHNFNRSLLAKQAWRIQINPRSLLSRLYKGRYYRSSTFLQSKSSSHSSFGWKSIQVGKELLQKGLRFKLGDGKSINVYEDPWLPTLPPSLVSGPKLYTTLTVNDLWYPGTKSWNDSLLHQILTPAEVELAHKIYLSKNDIPDEYIWPYTKNMEYSVKSGYWVATHLIHDALQIRPPTGEITLKLAYWKLEISPKIQHFFWKVLTGSLATATRLLTRKVHIDPICQWCCIEEESINHVLFMCPHAQQIWRCTNIPSLRLHRLSQDLEDNLRMLLLFHSTSTLPH